MGIVVGFGILKRGSKAYTAVVNDTKIRYPYAHLLISEELGTTDIVCSGHFWQIS